MSLGDSYQMTYNEAIELLERRGYRFFRQSKQLKPSSDHIPTEDEQLAISIILSKFPFYVFV